MIALNINIYKLMDNRLFKYLYDLCTQYTFVLAISMHIHMFRSVSNTIVLMKFQNVEV